MWSVSVPASVFSVIAEIFTSGWVSKVEEVRTVHWLTLGQLLISGDFFKSLVVVPSTAFSSSCIPYATTYFRFETLHDSWLTTCDVNIFSLFLPSSRFKRVLLRSPKGLYMLKSQESPRIQLANKKNAKGKTYSAQTARSKSSLWCAYDYAHTTAHTTCSMSVCFPDFFFLFMIWFDQRNVNPPKFKERQPTNAITRNYLFFPLLVIAFSVKKIHFGNQ